MHMGALDRTLARAQKERGVHELCKHLNGEIIRARSTLNLSQPSATCSTTPQRSMPGMNGSFGFIIWTTATQRKARKIHMLQQVKTLAQQKKAPRETSNGNTRATSLYGGSVVSSQKLKLACMVCLSVSIREREKRTPCGCIFSDVLSFFVLRLRETGSQALLTPSRRQTCIVEPNRSACPIEVQGHNRAGQGRFFTAKNIYHPPPPPRTTTSDRTHFVHTYYIHTHNIHT